VARGESGRIVIEVDQHLKSQVYVALARRNITLKAWFVSEAQRLVAPGNQMTLFREDEPSAGQAERSDDRPVASDSEEATYR
jgi:hypothetical protein